MVMWPIYLERIMRALLVLTGFTCVIAAAFIAATSSGPIIFLAAGTSLMGVISLLAGIAYE